MRHTDSSRFSGGISSLLTLPLLALLAACGSKDTGAKETTPGEGSDSTATLVFSAIPDDNKTELAARYQLVADHLSKELGVSVRFNPTSSYTASVEAFKSGDVQLAWFGGVTGVQARRAVEGAHAIAQGKVDPEYKSYFIANVNSGIEPGESFPEAMRGKNFTFGSESSTSGRVMPEFFIREATGQSPEEFFGKANRFSGSHDLTASQVQDGTADCGALSYKTYDRLVKKGTIDPEKCRIVWSTPSYPDYNWTAHPKLEEMFGEGFTEKLQGVLVGINDPALLEAMDRSEGIISAKSEDFDPIAATMKNMGMLRD